MRCAMCSIVIYAGMKTNETIGQFGKKGTEVQVNEAAEVQKPGTGEPLEQHVVVRQRVYLSGPISGYDYEERRITFGLWDTIMRAHGFEPVNPMENGVPKDAPSEEHMRVDLMMLLKCDCIMMLKGWERSLGARVEHEVALSCGMRVMNEWDPSMRDFGKTSELRPACSNCSPSTSMSTKEATES